MCQTKWPYSNILSSGEYSVYHSDNADGPRIKGVSIVYFTVRIIMIQLGNKPTKINLIQVDAPTVDKPEEELTNSIGLLSRFSAVQKS